MALKELQKLKIKKWAKEILTYLNNAKPDTTPERVRKNRERLLPSFVEMEDVYAFKDELPPKALAFLIELIRLLYEYQHYFDDGYRSSENIDTLSDKLKLSLAKVVKAEI